MSDKKRDIMILQSWFSPAFPIGAFSYSHGLETAIQDGLITDEVSLQSWLSTLLSYGAGRNDGIFIKETYKGEEGTNALCLALCTSKERWQETVELGQAFGRVVNSSYQTDLPDNVGLSSGSWSSCSNYGA